MKKIEIENIKLNNSVRSTQTRPLRGAKNREQGRSSASADFLLEAEKRGSPPKSEKAAAFWRVGGAGRGVQPFLREELSELSGEGIAESSLDSANRRIDATNKCAEVSCDGFIKVAESDILKSTKRGSIFRRFCGFSSARRENKTDESIDEPSAQNPAKAPKRQRAILARSAFGMIFAVILTVIVAGLGILGLKFSTQSLNTTTNEYIAIQLDLYMNSTTEIAILYVQRNGFVCNEGVDCDLGPNNISGQKPGVGKRTPKDPIEKYIEYGDSGEYKFTFKITPLDNYDKYDANEYMQIDDIVECEAQLGANPTKRCFREDTKNIFLLDIAGSVTNPLTNQTLRVTKRQVIKP